MDAPTPRPSSRASGSRPSSSRAASTGRSRRSCGASGRARKRRRGEPREPKAGSYQRALGRVALDGMMASRGFSGTVAVVTGASRGIGRAVAGALAAEGCQVVLAARDPERVKQAADEIIASGGQAWGLTMDVARRDSVDQAFQTVLAERGRIDHLVNNAGITRDNL